MNREKNHYQSCDDSGEINFKRHGIGKQIHKTIKVCFFIIIAFLSGALGATYIIENKLNVKLSTNSLIPDFNGESFKEPIFDSDRKIPASNGVVEDVASYVVGINTITDDFSNNADGGVTSGVIIDKDGYIVTTYSNVVGAKNIYVKLPSKGSKPLKGDIVNANKNIDLAVIKIDTKGLPAAKIADTSKVRVGDAVVALGNPLGEEGFPFATQGIVSSCNNVAIKEEGSSHRVFKTDAKVNQYNNGGILCNNDGAIIGVINTGLSQGNHGDNIGIAIDIKEAVTLVNSSKSNADKGKPNLGFKGGSIKPENKGIEGIYVQEVVPGQSLYNAGVKPTDIIVEIDGKKIKQYSDLVEMLNTYNIGDEVAMKVWRSGEAIYFNVKLTEKK